MYRTVKLLYRCANVFVLYPLIIYVLSTTLLLAAEAQAPPLQSDIKEAEKIVGRFLRNEAGTTWLSGLAKSRSAPLTTQDLMNEIIAATRPGGKVWKAASILSESLKNETLNGMESESVLGQPENWKDLIEHIENEKDIICLYRKNNEQGAEKENDWKTFLRTVSPGYTVHLAIDTGNKYVICLKKIEVPRSSPENNATTEEIMTTDENSSTANTSVEPTLVEIETILPITSEKQVNVLLRKSPTTSDATERNNNSDKNCNNGNQARGKLQKDARNSAKIDLYNEDMFEAFDNLGLPEEKYIYQLQSMKNEGSDYGNNGRAFGNSQLETPDGLNSLTPKDHECNRPIIVVMPNGNTPLEYQSWIPSGISKNVGAPTLPLPPLHSVPFRTMPPQHSNIFPSWLKLDNRGNPIVGQNQKMYIANPRPIVSQNPNFLDKMPGRNIQSPMMQSYPKPILNPVRNLNMMPIARPIMQPARTAFVPQPGDMKFRAPQDSDSIQKLRSPFGNNMPRRIESWSGPQIPYSHMRRPTKFTNWYVPPAYPRQNIPVKSNLIDNKLLTQLAQSRNSYGYREPMKNYKNYELQPQAPIFESRHPMIQKPVQAWNIAPRSLTRNVKISGRTSLITPSKFGGGPFSPPFRGINRNNSPFINDLRQNPVSQNLYQNPRPNLNPNYPVTNNFVQSTVRTPCSISRGNLHANNKDNPTAVNSLARPLGMCSNPLICTQTRNPLERSSERCPSPCDRPVKLQIFINGKVQEPLEVSVISESGQQVEIVGTGKSMMPYGGRALNGGTFLLDHFRDDEERVVDKVEQKHEEQKNTTDKAVASEGNTADQREKLDEDNNSTTELTAETTSVRLEPETSEGPEIEKRFFNEVRTEISFEGSTAEVNTTIPTMINATIIEY